MLDLVSSKLAFTRDARQLLVAHHDHVAWHATSGASRQLPIRGVHAIAAFGDQLWTVGTAGLERWSFHGRSIGAGVSISDDTVLVPAFAGPAAAACGNRLWIDDSVRVREVALADGALPFLGTRTFTVERQRGERVVRLGAASWPLPHGATLLGAAAMFDGAGVVLFVARGDVTEAWSSTAAGVVRHQIKLPPGRIRLAARRGIAIVHDGDEIHAVDLRYGEHLGTGVVAGEDLAIDPDGHYLATLCASEVRINTLGDAYAEHKKRSTKTMSEFDEWLGDTEGVRSLGQDLLGVAGDHLPGAGLMKMLDSGANLYNDIDQGNYTDAIGSGMGLVDGGFTLADDLGFDVGEGPGQVMNAAQGGWNVGSGIEKIVNGEEYSGEAFEGMHDILSGSGQLAEAYGGDVAMVGKALGVGLDIGDALAPYVYGEEIKGQQSQTIPEDGIWKPTTGNDTVDWLFGVN